MAALVAGESLVHRLVFAMRSLDHVDLFTRILGQVARVTCDHSNGSVRRKQALQHLTSNLSGGRRYDDHASSFRQQTHREIRRLLPSIQWELIAIELSAIFSEHPCSSASPGK
jgi:hypothetical protein